MGGAAAGVGGRGWGEGRWDNDPGAKSHLPGCVMASAGVQVSLDHSMRAGLVLW